VKFCSKTNLPAFDEFNLLDIAIELNTFGAVSDGCAPDQLIGLRKVENELESKCVAIETFQKLNSINAFNSG
jgi:hypothetical protein